MTFRCSTRNSIRSVCNFTDRLLSGSVAAWQDQLPSELDAASEWSRSTGFGSQLANDDSSRIEPAQTTSFGALECPTCRDIAATDQNKYAAQLLRRTASDPEVLNIGNTLLGSSWRQDPFDTHELLHHPRISLLLSHCK